MEHGKTPSQNFSALRRKAEERSIVGGGGGGGGWGDKPQVPENMAELINELRIHQAELEIQNEELKRSRDELACLHREFANLYEQAPCGYLTVNPKGIITRINRSGVKLLGENRERILNTEFYPYLAPPFQDLFWSARKRAAESGEMQNVELQMKTPNDFPAWVRADISADVRGDRIRNRVAGRPHGHHPYQTSGGPTPAVPKDGGHRDPRRRHCPRV